MPRIGPEMDCETMGNAVSVEERTFDIIIASAIPYVDAIVTERHLAEGLRKTKRLDHFIEHLTIQTLRDFRHSSPGAESFDAAR